MGRICLDFDGTLTLEDTDGSFQLIEGAREAIQELKEQGHEIVIYTSRIGLAAKEGDVRSEVELIREVLNEFMIPYDSIFMGDKLVADIYIDDRAVAYDGDWEDTLRRAKEKLPSPESDS